MSVIYQQKQARHLAVMICYQRHYLGVMPLSEEWLAERYKIGAAGEKLIKQVLIALDEHSYDIDLIISEHLIGWKQSLIHPLFNALLKVATAEILYCNSQQFKVIINEAVEFSKKYISESTAKMGNAVLDKIRLQAAMSD